MAVERKLTTIVSADVAQYSRLMAEDEEQTLHMFSAYKQIFESLVALHRGRIFNTAGDAILAEFGSAVEAVRCAIEIQAALRTRNDQFSPARQVRFRIGVNLGDVMVQGADLLGDGVNVAARLQSAAEPGGICISGSVYDQIRNKVSLSSKLLGEQKYKNISQLVRTYSITESEGYDTPSPSEMFAVSNIPIRAPAHFMGRDDALAAIEAALNRYMGRVAITALHGLRGVGKTTLAATFAERHRRDYRATWWIRAQTETTMRTDLIALAVRLGWVAAIEKEEPAVAAVMERLRHEGEGILLIYDNATDADALKPYLPRGGAAKVLVTSNAHAWRGVAVPVEIRLWPKEIGADYLIARTGRNAERAAAEILSEALGGLPLAHEQAAAYCERLDISLAEYGRRFTATPARLLDDERHAPAEYHDGLTVAKTFALAIEEAAKLHPAAESLIVHAALLAPEPIPLFLFAEAREKFGEPLATALAGDGLEEAVAALRTFALLSRETIADERDPAITTETLRLHRLVREVAAARRDGKAREEAFRALVAAVTAVYPEAEEVFTHPKTWPRARQLDALAFALVDGDITLPKGAEARAAELLHRLGAYKVEAAAYAQARVLLERALAIREKVLGPEHPDTAMSLNDLGFAIERQGGLVEARAFYERALAINDKVLDPEHPATAWSLHDLATLLLRQGDFAGARPLLERALAIREKVFGPQHPHTASDLAVLGCLLQAQGDFAGARPLHERALAIREEVRGPEHLETAFSLNNLAGQLHEQGDLVGARLLYERALTIREKVLGPEHPETANLLSGLGNCLVSQGDFAGARPLLRRALAICEKVLGPEHVETNRVRCYFARLLVAAGSAAEALTFGETALAGYEKILGKNHRWTKYAARTTADALAALGRNDKAAALRNRYGLEPNTRPAP